MFQSALNPWDLSHLSDESKASRELYDDISERGTLTPTLRTGRWSWLTKAREFFLNLHSSFNGSFGMEGGRGHIWYGSNLRGEKQSLQHSLDLLMRSEEWGQHFFVPYHCVIKKNYDKVAVVRNC